MQKFSLSKALTSLAAISAATVIAGGVAHAEENTAPAPAPDVPAADNTQTQKQAAPPEQLAAPAGGQTIVVPAMYGADPIAVRTAAFCDKNTLPQLMVGVKVNGIDARTTTVVDVQAIALCKINGDVSRELQLQVGIIPGADIYYTLRTSSKTSGRDMAPGIVVDFLHDRAKQGQMGQGIVILQDGEVAVVNNANQTPKPDNSRATEILQILASADAPAPTTEGWLSSAIKIATAAKPATDTGAADTSADTKLVQAKLELPAASTITGTPANADNQTTLKKDDGVQLASLMTGDEAKAGHASAPEADAPTVMANPVLVAQAQPVKADPRPTKIQLASMSVTERQMWDDNSHYHRNIWRTLLGLKAKTDDGRTIPQQYADGDLPRQSMLQILFGKKSEIRRLASSVGRAFKRHDRNYQITDFAKADSLPEINNNPSLAVAKIETSALPPAAAPRALVAQPPAEFPKLTLVKNILLPSATTTVDVEKDWHLARVEYLHRHEEGRMGAVRNQLAFMRNAIRTAYEQRASLSDDQKLKVARAALYVLNKFDNRELYSLEESRSFAKEKNEMLQAMGGMVVASSREAQKSPLGMRLARSVLRRSGNVEQAAQPPRPVAQLSFHMTLKPAA